MPDAQRILVISPHPDDESIGCGGTLHECASRGGAVEVIFLTSGENGGHGLAPEETRKLREQEARDAAKILGVANVEFWHEPDGSVAVSPELVRRLTQRLKEFKADVLVVPHENEEHADHRAAAELARQSMLALAAEGNGHALPEMWLCEIWTPIQQVDQIVDISASLDAKLAAIRAHKSQCDVMAFDDAARGLARFRGEMYLWPGGDYAEAFTEWRLPRRIGRG